MSKGVGLVLLNFFYELSFSLETFLRITCFDLGLFMCFVYITSNHAIC